MTQGKGPPDSSHLQDARVHYTVPKQQPHTPATTPPTKAARPRQTQDKHRNTKNPATQEETQPTITTPTPQGPAPQQPITSSTRDGGLLPQNPTACQTIQTTQHHHRFSNTTTTQRIIMLRTHQQQHHAATASTPHTPHNPTKDQSGMHAFQY